MKPTVSILRGFCVIAAVLAMTLPQAASAYQHETYKYFSQSKGKRVNAVRIYNNHNESIRCTITVRWQVTGTFATRPSTESDSVTIIISPGDYGSSTGMAAPIIDYNTNCRGA